MYCCPCRFFSRRSDIQITPFASASGFKNLKNTSIRMPEAQSTVHLKDTESVTAWAEFLRMLENNASIAHMLNVDHAKHIQENRHYLTAILKSVLLCCRRHGIAFRGHRKDLTNKPMQTLAISLLFLGIVSNMIILCLLDCWAWMV